MEEVSELSTPSFTDTNCSDQNFTIQISVANVTGRALEVQVAGTSFLGGMRCQKVPAQAHIQCDRNAHHDQRAYTQDQEPPDHPHNKLG
jgi:hypothetical protein